MLIARGGIYAQTADTQTAYLGQFLRFIGLTDLEFVHAEGLGISDETREKSLAAAQRTISQLVAQPMTA